MIRPASEILYPPTEALCFKARMLANVEHLAKSSEGVKNSIENQIHFENTKYFEEIKALNAQQEVLLENMRRIIEKS